jgi:hypothetical protein
MSVVETALVFVGIPLAFVTVMALLVFGRSQFTAHNRYRPGKPWNYPPVWYLPHPTTLPAPDDRPALPPGATGTDAVSPERAVGGASGEW